MRAAITGGSGVVGSALIRHLVAAGNEVVALARSAVSRKKLEDMGAATIEGTILDPEALSALTRDAEVVYHVAGVNEVCPSDPEMMWRVNVEGTRAVMAACRRMGVRRLVHTSSAVTIGERQGTIATEDSEHRGFFLSEYERSKHEAERVLFEASGGLEVVSVNPSSVQGPGRSTGTGRIFLAAARGDLPVLFHTNISLVDIDDCAAGHLLAAERGVPGRRYLLSGASLSISEAVRLLSRETGRGISPWYVTEGVVRGAAAVVEAVWRLRRRPPPFCREAARIMIHGHRYDGSRAVRELGLRYTPIIETIRKTLAWFGEAGLLNHDE